MNFHDSTSAGNARITNTSAFVNFDGTTTAGNAVINNSGEAQFQFIDHSNAGTATIINSANLAFGTAASAAQATIVNAMNGVTSFGGSSTAGNATIITNNGGAVNFFEDSTGGQARLITNAGGIVDLSFHTGGLSVGSIEGAGRYFLGSNQLTVGTNNLSTEVSGTIADGGGNNFTIGAALVKTGTGTLTLSGANAYTGPTTVNAGTLLVNGSIASSSLTTVGHGAILGGTGTVGTTTVASGGVLSPGAGSGAPGTLRVAGNLTFQPGAQYLVQASSSIASSAMAAATGTASLAGAVSASLAAGSTLTRQYTILHSGRLIGTFDAFSTTNLPLGFVPSLSYTNSDAVLNLTAMLGGQQQLPGNQANVANAINDSFNQGGTLPAAFTTLFGQTGATLTQSLTGISGEAGSSLGARQAALQMTNSFLALLLDPFGGPPGGAGRRRGLETEAGFSPEAAEVYAAITPMVQEPSTPDKGWGVWGQAYGGTTAVPGVSQTGTHDTAASGYGFATGADYRVTPNALIGFAVAGGSTHFHLASNLGGGKGDLLQFGVYGSQRFGASYMAAAFSYARHDTTTNRTVIVSGTEVLTAHFGANNFGGRLETGHHFTTPLVGITPYAALQVQNFGTPSYSEGAISGANSFALAYAAKATTAVRTELGAWLEKTFALNASSLLTLRTRAAWVHDSASSQSATAMFEAVPGSDFTVNSAAIVPNSALLSASAEINLSNRLTLGTRFDGQLGNRSQSYAGIGTLRYEW